MGILDKLKPQPRWKHVDPTIRLEALHALEDSGELAVMAETDPDARVRRAAVARLDDPGVLSRVLAGDTDSEAQELAADRLFELATTGVDGTATAAVAAITDPRRLSTVAKSDAPESVCAEALRRTADMRALTSIARQAGHESIALAALARLTAREDVLTVALTADARDVALQAFARLGEASDLDELRSIEKGAQQKAVSRRARDLIVEIETAEAARRQADEARQRQQAAVCEAVDHLTQVTDTAVARAELTRLTESWQQLTDVDDDARRRFSQAASDVQAAIAHRELEAEEAAAQARQRAEAVATREALCERVETLDGDDVLEQLVPIEEEWRSLLPFVGNGPEADRLAKRFAVAVAACRKRHEMGAQLAESRASLETLVAEAESLPSHEDAAAAAARWRALSREARGLTALLSDASRPAPVELTDRLAAVDAAFARIAADHKAAAARAEHDLLAQLQRLIERATRAHESESVTLREGDRLMRDIKTSIEAVVALDPIPAELEAAAAQVRSLQEKVAPRVRELREMDDWRRFANAQAQEKFIAMAEAIVASLHAEEEAGTESDLAATARALRELNAKWREAAEAPRHSAQRLWDRFRTATDFIRSRCEVHFTKLREERTSNLTAKVALVDEAETLANSTEWAKTAARFQHLQEAWKTVGPVPRDAARDLAHRFRTSSNTFFARRREDLASRKKAWAENLAKKVALCEEAEALSSSTEWETAVPRLKQLQADWKTIGPVRRTKSDEVWARFRAAADTFFDRYHRRHEIALSTKLAERETMVVEMEALSVAENGHVPADMASQVENLRTQWNRAVPIPSPDMKPLDNRWQTAFGRLIARRPDLFAGTDLDPITLRSKMQKLVDKVEALVDLTEEAQPTGVSRTELLAERLRAALASNAIGGRSDDGAKWRRAMSTVKEARASWQRLPPVPDADALRDRFEAACRRIADEARKHAGSSPRPPQAGKPAKHGHGAKSGKPGKRGHAPRRPEPVEDKTMVAIG